MTQFDVIKSNGEQVPLDREKMRHSLINSGVKAVDAPEILEQVLSTLTSPVTTRRLYKSMRKFLRSYSPLSQMKYSLKEAIYDLGPTGYPFERYVSKILEQQGYEVEVGKFVEGRCVSHEVDVVATRGKTCYMVECKFHHNGKTHSNVKTALYVHARFLDIKAAYKDSKMEMLGLEPQGMLVTNTMFTSEAVKYAECVGVKIVGWKHPKGDSLERMIEEGKTYPVTVLPSVNKKNIQTLISHDLVTVMDVERMEVEEFGRLTGLSDKEAGRIYSQARAICVKNHVNSH